MSYLDTRQKLAQALGFFWLKVFTDQAFVEGYVNAIAVEFWELDRLVQELPDYQSRYLLPLKDVSDARLFLFDESTLTRTKWVYGGGLTYGADAAYGQQHQGSGAWSYASDETLVPNFLTVGVLGNARILTLGVDYAVADGRIVFRDNPLELANLQVLPTAADGETKMKFLLWGFQVERDLRAVQNFFGVLAGVVANSTLKYQEAVNIAWDLRVDGASKRNINRVLCFISDTDYVEQDGQVRDIFVEGNRWCVVTENAVYTAPLEATVLTVKGAELRQGDFIFNSYAVRYEKEEVDFADFGGLLLDVGLLGPGYRSGVFAGNTLVPVTKTHAPTWTYVTPA